MNKKFKKIKLYKYRITVLIIVVLIIISLIFSIVLKYNKIDLASSIFANIFAGLITGLTIYILTNIKIIDIKKTENKMNFLEAVHEILLEFLGKCRKTIFYDIKDYEDFANISIDTLLILQKISALVYENINTNKKWFNMEKYLLKSYNISIDKFEVELKEIYDFINSNYDTLEGCKQIKNIISDLEYKMFFLNSQIINDMKLMKNELVSINKTIV